MRVAALVVAAALIAGCGFSSPESSEPTRRRPSQQQLDRQDARAIERQVNEEVQDRLQTSAAEQGDYVEADTTCTKQSNTAYKCLTSLTRPPGSPDVLTNVTCDRNGGSCITESR